MKLVAPSLSDLETVAPLCAQAVAATVARVSDSEKRRVIWHLHWISHQPGGLTALAKEMLDLIVPNRLGTPTMRSVGVGAGIVYSGDAYEEICFEIDSFEHRPKGEIELEIERHMSYLVSREGLVAKLRAALHPARRRATCIELLDICLDRCRELPAKLEHLCLCDDVGDWSSPHFEGFSDVLNEALAARSQVAFGNCASTRILGHVHDAMNFAWRNRSLAVIHGTERIGKSVATRCWQEANAGRARLIDLMAATTDILFYQELFKALGCGDIRRGDANELRAAIRDAVSTRDLMLIFDEAHCLFGLSARASIKRLEYIRTEFVNRGIPVVLVVTPQFSDRLREMERTTGFNTNQFRGRITKWAELPRKPSRPDVECVCRHLLPGIPEECATLLVDCAISADTPLAALNNAVLEARMLAEKRDCPVGDLDVIRTAIGYSLATRQMLESSIPAPHPTPRRRRINTTSHLNQTASAETTDAGGLQAPRMSHAKEVTSQAPQRGQGALCVT